MNIRFSANNYNSMNCKNRYNTPQFGMAMKLRIDESVVGVKKFVFENYYVNSLPITSYLKLDKCAWGYKMPIGSKELKPYIGSLEKNEGFSTEAGGYGGGWIKSDINTPLSTKDVHTCALLNVVNEFNGKQMMYHVYPESRPNEIKELLINEFPRFTRVNILPGDQYKTNNTVNNIITAVDMVNPNVVKQYYHMPVENPEVVSVGGELHFLENRVPDRMTFTEVKDQYNY